MNEYMKQRIREADEHKRQSVEEKAELLHRLMELAQYALGNRESREGNPYTKPSVQAALKTIARYRGKDDFFNALEE